MFSKIFNSRSISNYKRMWPYVKPYWFRALLAMGLSVPVGALDAVIAWCMKPYLDTVVLSKTTSDAPTSWWILALIVGVAIFQGLLNYGSAYLNTWVGTHIVNDLKIAMFDKLLSFETSFFDKRNSGDIHMRFSGDPATASTGLLADARVFVSRFVSSVSLICVLIINSWKLSLIAVIVLTISFYPMTLVRRRMAKIVDESVKSGAQISTAYNETFMGNRTITAYNYQEAQKNKFNSILKLLARLSLQMVKRTSWVSPMMHIVASIGIAITIGYGAHLISTDQITAGGFVSFLTALLLLYTPLKTIGDRFKDVQISLMAMDRMFEMMDIVPSIRNKENPVELIDIKKEIEFCNVNFSYIPNTPVLKNFSLKTKVGQCIALVGNSGGGKSTIVSLLPRFYDVESGEILIDGIDIRDISLKSLRDKMSVVFQDNFLFAGTIRDNIKIGKPDATDEEIWHALDMAYLTEFVSSLKDGLDSYIGERGVLLSGGQKQRVAIARAFIKNSEIIILDEATSALDNKAEAIVQLAIENLMKNRTVFVIAHRLSTIQNADLIVVINEGQIAEMGSHAELMAHERGPYKILYDTQFNKLKGTAAHS